MTTDRDVDRITAAFLRDGPAELSDRVLDDAFSEIHLTRQRRRPAVPWRNGPVSSFSPRLAAIIAVIALGGAALAVWSGSQGIALRASPAPPTVAQPATPPPTAAPATTAVTASRRAALLAPQGYADGGTIAFTRDDPAVGGPAPFLIDPTGENEARVNIQHGWGGASSVPQTGCCVVFSPDGNQYAVGFDEQNQTRGSGLLSAAQVFDLDGTGVSMVPAICGACVSIQGINYVPRAWSSNNLVATEVWSDTDPSKNGINLAPMGASRTDDWDTQVTGAYRDVPMTFSPDGSKLLFTRLDLQGDSGALNVLTIASHTIQRLSEPGTKVFANGYFGDGASWSPDGKRVAFAATDATGDAEQMTVYVVPASGGKPTAIAGPSSFVTSAHWSPDGTWIAFDWDSGAGTHDLHVIHPDGSGEINLTDAFAPGLCCSRWSPDGAALLAAATLGPNEQSNLVIVPVNGDPVRQVTTVPAQYNDYSWGPVRR